MPRLDTMRKVTVSLPPELVAFADKRARELHTSRSQIISMALSAVRTSEEAQLAAEGYRFYAQESTEFADASQQAVAEAWQAALLTETNGMGGDDGQTR